MGRKILNLIFVVAGFLCAGLGTLGVVLPLIPTTPFYLLAVVFFAKGSKRFHDWFTSTRVYKRHLSEFVKSRGMTLRTKLMILLPVTVLFMFYFVTVPVPQMRFLFVFLLITKYSYFFLRIKTLPPNDKA